MTESQITNQKIYNFSDFDFQWLFGKSKSEEKEHSQVWNWLSFVVTIFLLFCVSLKKKYRKSFDFFTEKRPYSYVYVCDKEKKSAYMKVFRSFYSERQLYSRNFVALLFQQ